MPDFDTRRPQDQNVPNEPRIGLVANKLRTALMASRLRILFMGGGILLLVAGATVITQLLQDQFSGVSEDAIVIQGPALLPSEGGETTYADDLYPNSHIYVIDQDGTNEARSIPVAENVEGASMSPDGEKIAFLSLEFEHREDIGAVGVVDVYVMNPNGTNKTTITTNYPFLYMLRTVRGQVAWSPDSKRIAFPSYTQLADTSASAASASPASAAAEEINGIYVANASGWGSPSIIRDFPEEASPNEALPSD